MATKQNGHCLDEFPMASGDGDFSYIKNSFYQRRVVIASKLPMHEVVEKSLDVEELAAWHPSFRIADMGCSVGPNTFISVQNILEALLHKCQTLKHQIPTPEFQIFFNDHALNDFNMLFKSLPPNKQYYVAGVPGSFYSRVFPNASLHIVNCSFGLHFLSRVPISQKEPSWNKGKIFYSHSGDEVVNAYSNQYANDMDCFLHARAQEIVPGGLLVFAVPACPDGVSHSQVYFNVLVDILGSCFVELAKKGVIDEEKVDSFNLSVYITSPQEVEAAIKRNGCFDIEKLESLPKETSPNAHCRAQDASCHIRAITEHLIKDKFGPMILDELFELYTQKLEEAYEDLSSKEAMNFFVALKRKANDQ